MIKLRRRIVYYLTVSILAAFLVLTLIVLEFPFSIADREFSEEIQEHHFSFLDYLTTGISMFGYMPYSVIMVMASAIIFYLLKYKRESLFIMLTLLSGLVSSSIKVWINRPRPTEDLVRIIEKTKRQSFPSGHVMFYVVFFGFLILLMYTLKNIHRSWRIGIAATSGFLIVTIPFSRIYLGAHWFTDVMGGFLLGVLYLLILIFFYLKKERI